MGPKPETKKSPSYRLRIRANLRAAWQTIYDNGIHSASHETKEQVKQFARKSDTAIGRIQKQLHERTFKFRPAHGIAVKKKNKRDKRGIVLFPIEDRIVQRALLNVLQSIPSIKTELEAGFNFGGIKGKSYGVPAAVEKALEAAQRKDYSYYIRTDISRFFDSVPRQQALDALAAHVDDEPFVHLLREAANIELDNLKNLSPAEISLFPLGNEGVAQGSCLSPLICNFLLSPFDRQMNDKRITCIRYIDDFILFADSKERAHKALAGARRSLRLLGLEAYSPDERTDKAAQGSISGGFTFLGCDIHPQSVRPSSATRKKLLERVRKLLNDTLQELRDPEAAAKKDVSVLDAIVRARNIIQGWGNTYSFCTDRHLMIDLDREIGKSVSAFLSAAKCIIAGLSDTNRHRALGLYLLADCKTDGADERCKALIRNFTAAKIEATPL